MRVRKTFLILYLATGLSVGLLSSCNPFSKSQEQPPASSTGTSNQPVTDNQQTPAITNLELEELIKKRAALNTFVANIKVTEKQTKVENPVDYAEAKKIVDELANAYKTFKDSLSNDIKTKIGFNNIDSKIEPILEGTSQQRKILEDLASKQHRQAQIKLQNLGFYTQTVDSTDPGQDGDNQRIATKELLKQILNVTQPLATLKIDNSSEQPTLTTDDLKTQLEQLKKDINRNNWVWPLFNTLALLSVPISFIFLWSRMTGVLITYKTKKPTDSSDEQQKILVELPKIKSVIEGLQEKVSWLQILPFNKKQLSSSEVKEIEKSLENVRKQFNGLYEKIIISQSILVESDNDKQEEDTKAVYFQNWLEKLLQSIKKEIITDVKSTSLDETTQNTLKDLSNKFSNIQEIVGSLSIGKEGGSISQHKEKVDQLDIKIKEYEDQKERHLTRIRELTDERNRLSQNLAEQRQQIEQFSSGEVEQLRKENQRLSSSSQNLETRLGNVKIEKAQLEQQATTLNSQVNQLQQDKKDLELTANENVQEIKKLKKEIDRLTKLVKKEAIETGDIPGDWQSIITHYNQSPDAIFNVHGVQKQGEVVEDEEKGGERRNNSSKPVVLTSNVSPDGFYIVLVGNDYLLFPKQHAIAASQKFTVSALFDGYRSGNTSKFTLISPAQVTPDGGSGRWQLKYKGKLEYN
ncbi:MAG: hypothetical protein EWV82_05420 [Microcystis aeruginosa Ma_AC_P_19900807_S299]|jgi:hypothetical protein|uniref:Uncharacterized protein n=1 Tax=Microcystis aeruginosa Ma_SC_T_19800800_S464 TaxID=2486257 RepID=A0A552E5U1_MICAE|nr:MAG: hypothetical protein EWV82_05420 [Microcystis aeruginosa Ma_AC_P_19900807_S299]TRU29877.1 MAG: hypothetical protein EWV81_01425 [Microcystis aeruginosa Ma_SC_T_19800800_S464]